ncbi:MAG: L-lactate dehydrogenase [Butyrivibrio sp.]|nr:L-lactate dehydrogenase [Butyrivibrio sp.]MEE3471728.1 L-lactate dehydrogenase [Butyrivibrio hungatei]
MSDFKVGIIGLGHVGAHVLYTLALQGLADDFLLVDLEEKKGKLSSERQDVLDSMEFLPHKVSVRIGEIEDLGDRDVIINAVGDIAALKGTGTRLMELEFNSKAILSYADRLRNSGFNGILINISNPCDVITKKLSDLLGFEKGKVFGTGTGLDTARLKLRLQESTGISAQSLTAYMIGEHGSNQIAPRSVISFNGLSLEEYEKAEGVKLDLDAIEKDAKEGGWITYNGKFCTEYAIALTAARLVRYIRYDEKAVVPVSALLEGEYGESGLFVGVPAVVGRGGVERVVEIPLSDNDKKRFHECCESIRANL